jgi:hypothetical protein
LLEAVRQFDGEAVNIDNGAMTRARVLHELSEDALECRMSGLDAIAEVIDDFSEVIVNSIGHHQPITAVTATHTETGLNVSLLCYAVFTQTYRLAIGDKFSVYKRWAP